MEKVVLVDLKDNVIGEMEKMEAHEKAMLHRAVSVFIFNSDNKLLLQRRALTKYHSPGLWTNTACTHPRKVEDNKKAAIRRLKEEMGIEINSLTKAFDFIYKEKLENDLIEYEFDHVFIGFSDDAPIVEPTEVCEYEYVDIDEIMGMVNKYPDLYTVWFKKIIERVVVFVKNEVDSIVL